MTARVRPGTAGDVRAIIEISGAVSESVLNPAQVTRLLESERGIVLVAESGGVELTGYCLAESVLDEATLLDIAVAPGHQGDGVGARLLDRLLELLRQQGRQRCLLEVRESNPAIRLYRRRGFVDDGVRRGYYPAGNGREDARLMSCRLAGEP